MSANRLITSRHSRCKASVSRNQEQPAPRASKVLAERNQAVVAVGAWVESGQDCPEHPSVSGRARLALSDALALLTEEIQAEKRRENEESLRRFQDEVRHRVAQQAQASRRRDQPMVNPDRRTPHQQYQVWTQHVSAGEKLRSAGGAAQQRLIERSPQESSEGMRQVRLRLAACRMIPHGEMMSDLPGGVWNVSPTRHKAGSHVLRAEQEVEEEDVEGEEEEEEEDVEEEGDIGDRGHLFTSQHACPLVQHKLSGPVLENSDESEPDPGFQSNLAAARVLWPPTDPEEVKRQRQSQFLMQRRLYMSIEREQVKENKQHRKHLKRTARIKAEKEQIRLEEERRLERARQLADARQKLEERELLILGRLKLEEEERAAELQRRKRDEKEKVSGRFIDALRAQMKERLSQEKLDLPPLCCCASSFWDSHPDTCANNCVFHNNPKAYAKALHSTMLSLDLQ
ncbi:coiled-coil domain-containing protein 15 isoform X2 [Larimichthys crocea]|uniref:coiled-coil domain-containing protein 15 isoform X2 n=1 Tax=Larimichthys crocea TaxID=215358 RepID=UPI000F5FF461|nr:coiled-coil domain-containing protein 15 isoform X2 [Larimichthys crocea]